jgi:hypothetical protein
MSGNWDGRTSNMAAIHCAFEPPLSVEATSPSIIGLLGAIDPVIVA